MCRALILSKKISPRAFKETAKKGTEAGEVGIEGTTIQKPDQVRLIRTFRSFSSARGRTWGYLRHCHWQLGMKVDVFSDGMDTVRGSARRRALSWLPTPNEPFSL